MILVGKVALVLAISLAILFAGLASFALVYALTMYLIAHTASLLIRAIGFLVAGVLYVVLFPFDRLYVFCQTRIQGRTATHTSTVEQPVLNRRGHLTLVKG